MEPIATLGFDHIDLTVNDLERSKAYYGKVLSALGFRWVREERTVIWASGQTSIAIRGPSEEERGAAFDRYRVGLHHLALRAKSRDDVDRFHGFLLKEGLPVLDAPAEYPLYGELYYAVFFADPDGMKLELVHFPWGYWKRTQTAGHDERPRHLPAQEREPAH